MNDSKISEKYKEYLPRRYPVRHKRKIPLEPDVKLSHEYRTKIRRLFEMDAELDMMILGQEDYIGLVVDAYASNIHWSTHIEGNPLSLEYVKRTSDTVLRSKTVIREENPGPVQDILNHLYTFFMKDGCELPWTAEVLKDTHRMLMDRTGLDCRPGEFSDEQMCIRGYDGNITFLGCPATHIPEELENLVEWVSSSPFDEIVTSVIFFHEFESIRPFKDGNGRTGRTLFQILLNELGLNNINLCLIEEKFLSNEELYYTLMEYTDDCGDYTVLTEFIIDNLICAYEEAVGRFSKKDIVGDLDETSRKIIYRSKKTNDWFVLSDAVGWVTGVGEQTVRTRIKELIGLGVLIEEGATKGKRFRFADPFADLKDNISKVSGTLYE